MKEHNMTMRNIATALLAGAIFMSASALADDAASAAADARTRKLEQQIELMSQQLQALKAELKQVETQNEAIVAQQQQQAVMAQQSSQSGGGISDKLSLWGYGELTYDRPVHQTDKTTADLARAVFGIGYHFDDRTVFNSEFEVEHAVSSADDPGEFEVEQFFIDHQLTDWANVKAGLFLMPFGLLNEYHEPNHYFGVHRNLVETLIIPSTWREGGVGLHGNTESGFGWDAGLTTGFDLSKYDPNPSDPLYTTAFDLEEGSPLQASHQELALANAQHLAQYVSLNYHGIPGLTAGTAFFTGVSPMLDPAVAADTSNHRINLWQAHARWTPGKVDLSALYARGSISNTGSFNLMNPGISNPLPAVFEGYYAQAAYNVWESGDYKLSPFVRWEHYDLGKSYKGTSAGSPPLAGSPAASGVWPSQNDNVWTAGANFYLNPNVVVKADYQSFDKNTDFTRFDLGLGVTF